MIKCTCGIYIYYIFLYIYMQVCYHTYVVDFCGTVLPRLHYDIALWEIFMLYVVDTSIWKYIDLCHGLRAAQMNSILERLSWRH